MRSLTNAIRWVRGFGSFSLLFVGVLALGTTPGLYSSPTPERIEASYAQSGVVISVSLVIYGYTTPAELEVLSRAFEEGQDQGLAAALSNTKAAGTCSIAGSPSFDVAFIQVVVTPAGRQITFITDRPLESDEAKSSMGPPSFDVLVGQFDLNDTEEIKSTGFLYPASKLVIDQQGKYHYDLAASPWPLVNFLDSNWAPVIAVDHSPYAISAPLR